MMLAACLLLGAVAQSSAHAPSGAPEITIWGIGAPGGPMKEYSVPAADFAQVPPWVPDKDSPPLPISRAVGVARKALKADHPDWTESESLLWSVQLQQVQSADSPNRWFYVLMFRRMVAGHPLPLGEATIVVLMNGTVVEPKITRSLLTPK